METPNGLSTPRISEARWWVRLSASLFALALLSIASNPATGDKLLGQGRNPAFRILVPHPQSFFPAHQAFRNPDGKGAW
jgi:hypothetical protein